METHSSILGMPKKSLWTFQRSLVGYSPWGRKESDMIELMSTHVRSQNSLKLNCEAGPKMTHPTASTGHRHCHLNHAGHQTLMSE